MEEATRAFLDAATRRGFLAEAEAARARVELETRGAPGDLAAVVRTLLARGRISTGHAQVLLAELGVPIPATSDDATIVPAGARLPPPPSAGANTLFDDSCLPSRARGTAPQDATIVPGPGPASLAADEAESTLRRSVAAQLSELPGASEGATPPVRVPRDSTALNVRYQPRELLGQGGMGRVIAALDPSLQREVAIKSLLDPQGGTDTQRFLDEAQITGQLEHPNIVPVHELGHDPRSGPYLVMKRVKGRSLKDVLRLLAEGKPGALARLAEGEAPSRRLESLDAAPLPTGAANASSVCDTRSSEPPAPDRGANPALAETIPPGATGPAPARESVAARRDPRPGAVPDAPENALPWLLNLYGKVCEAVAYAHSRGVIHRDLKPENIMVGEFGEVLVMDWGLAKVLGRDAPGDDRRVAVRYPEDGESTVRTMDGEVMGTPMYMPPEQARGQIEALDERSDVYSLGAILYEILALERPFEGAHVVQVLAKVIDGDFSPPSRRGRAPWEVPRELEAVVLKAMAADRAGRYPSVLALKQDVEAWFGGRRLSAADYSAWDLVLKWVKRRVAFPGREASAHERPTRHGADMGCRDRP